MAHGTRSNAQGQTIAVRGLPVLYLRSTLSLQALPAALLTQILNLPPNLQGDGNLVAGLAAGQYGCCASRLAESVRNEQEMRTLLHRGKRQHA